MSSTRNLDHHIQREIWISISKGTLKQTRNKHKPQKDDNQREARRHVALIETASEHSWTMSATHFFWNSQNYWMEVTSFPKTRNAVVCWMTSGKWLWNSQNWAFSWKLHRNLQHYLLGVNNLLKLWKSLNRSDLSQNQKWSSLSFVKSSNSKIANWHRISLWHAHSNGSLKQKNLLKLNLTHCQIGAEMSARLQGGLVYKKLNQCSILWSSSHLLALKKLMAKIT